MQSSIWLFLLLFSVANGESFNVTPYNNPTILHPFDYENLCPDIRYALRVQVNQEYPCICFKQGTYSYYGTEVEQCHEYSAGVLLTVPHQGNCYFVHNETRAFQKMTRVIQPEVPLMSTLLPECEPEIRHKRSVDIDPYDTDNEDLMTSGVESSHKLMKRVLNDYIVSQIAKLAGIQGDMIGINKVESSESDDNTILKQKIPAVKLLEYTKVIMQRTCLAVNPQFLEVAFNSFINLQLNFFYIEEPYMSTAAFHRIVLAMNKCLGASKPYIFVKDIQVNISTAEVCDSHVSDRTSNVTVHYQGGSDETEDEVNIPDHVNSMMNITSEVYTDPLIEMVWKMFLNAHSRCYMAFMSHFNDHHLFTLTLLRFFTNEVHDIWLKGYSSNFTTDSKLYGGLFGDVNKLMKDIDICVMAAKKEPYDWVMARPARDKSNIRLGHRSKRAESNLYDDDDPEDPIHITKLHAKKMMKYKCKLAKDSDKLCRVTQRL